MVTAEVSKFNALPLPPETYDEWLVYFDLLKADLPADDKVAQLIAKGSFCEKGYTEARLKQRLTETVYIMLNKRIGDFLYGLNVQIALKDMAGIAALFAKLGCDVKSCLFFRELGFLEQSDKMDLEQAVKAQVEAFWNGALAFLHQRAKEDSGTELNEALKLICAMRPFTETADEQQR